MAKSSGKSKVIDPKHKLFVMHFTRPGAPTFNNGTLAYAVVYSPQLFQLSREVPKGRTLSPFDSKYDVCKTMASKLLSKPDIQAAVDDRLSKLFGDNDALDRRLAQLAYQSDDLHVSRAAISDVNKLKRRINDEPAIPPGASPIARIEIVMPPSTPNIRK